MTHGEATRRNTMPNELKSCPFCGGEAEIVPHKFFSEILKAWMVDCYGVECKNCHTSGYQFWGTEAHAIAAWNRRCGDDSN